MGFKSKAAVAVSGALTAGAFATLAGAIPAGAATYGTEQSEGGVVFAVGNNSAIVGAGHTGPNTEFARTQQGNRITFRASNNRCVTDGFGGLSLQHCNNSQSQKFGEVGFGQYVALQNEGSHQYVTEHGPGRPVTTDNVRRDRRGHLNFSRSQEWKWTTFNIGGRPGGGNGGGGNPGHNRGPVTATASTKITNNADGGHSSRTPYWAIDNFTRTVTVKLGTSVSTSHCGTSTGHCYSYTGTLRDRGTFTTIPRSDAPNQGGYPGSVEARRPAHGTIDGNAPIIFYATSDQPNGHYVVRSHDDGGVKPESGPFSTGGWVAQFFSGSTTVAGVNFPTYKWTYKTTDLRNNQTWIDSSTNGDGNQLGDGNITG
jgi:hypothetical protein